MKKIWLALISNIVRPVMGLKLHMCASTWYLPFNKEACRCLFSQFLFAKLINKKEVGENEERHSDYLDHFALERISEANTNTEEM